MPIPRDERDDPRQIWMAVGIGLALFLGLYLVFAPTGGSAPEPGLKLDLGKTAQPAEFSWDLEDLDGKPVAFSTFKGKAVFLNVWATWCGPCVREMPSIARLAANPRLKDVAFVCVSTDEANGVVKAYLEGKGFPMTVLRAHDLPPIFTTEGIPATFLIGPDGKVAASQVGASDWDTPEIVAALESLAKPKPETPADAPKVTTSGGD